MTAPAPGGPSCRTRAAAPVPAGRPSPYIEPEAWDERTELPAEVLDCLQRPPGQVVVIIATVDEDGAPRTGAMRAISPRRLRFACRRSHATFVNVTRHGRVMVALYAAPDIAVGVRGRAWVAQQELSAWPDNAMIGIEVETVKNDALPQVPIATGITYAFPDELADRLAAVHATLAAPPPSAPPRRS